MEFKYNRNIMCTAARRQENNSRYSCLTTVHIARDLYNMLMLGFPYDAETARLNTLYTKKLKKYTIEPCVVLHKTLYTEQFLLMDVVLRGNVIFRINLER